MKLRKIALRNIGRNRRRSILSASAIVIAAMSMVLMFSILEGMKKDLHNNLQKYYTGEIRIRNIEYDKNENLHPLHLRIEAYEEVLAALKSFDFTALISPRIQFPTSIYREGANYKALGLGVDFDYETAYQGIAGRLIEGELPEKGKNQMLISPGLAREMGVATGDKITLLSRTMRGGTNAITFQISGKVSFPVEALNNNFFLAPLDRVQYFLKTGEAVIDILVILNNGYNSQKAAAALNNLPLFKEKAIEAKSWDTIATTYSFIKMAESMYLLIALFFFLLGSTVIINTTMMVIYERIREIGTLNALGMEEGTIVRLFFLEAVFISFFGSLAGVLLGIAIAIPLSYIGIDLSGPMQGMTFEISPRLYPMINLRSTIFVFAYSVIIASLASLIPSRRASKIEPIEALRSI
ncbi:MAG: FtsX-like permease family protein [Spirochaetota bacterium]